MLYYVNTIYIYIYNLIRLIDPSVFKICKLLRTPALFDPLSFSFSLPISSFLSLSSLSLFLSRRLFLAKEVSYFDRFYFLGIRESKRERERKGRSKKKKRKKPTIFFLRFLIKIHEKGDGK